MFFLVESPTRCCCDLAHIARPCYFPGPKLIAIILLCPQNLQIHHTSQEQALCRSWQSLDNKPCCSSILLWSYKEQLVGGKKEFSNLSLDPSHIPPSWWMCRLIQAHSSSTLKHGCIKMTAQGYGQLWASFVSLSSLKYQNDQCQEIHPWRWRMLGMHTFQRARLQSSDI